MVRAMENDLQTRRTRYYKLNTHLAHIDNQQLQALFTEGDKTEGWGTNHVITLAGTKVFVKSIPVTAVEYQQMFSTKNLYDLPTYYSYGVGSAGFGAFRELVAHIKTTNWVLAGAIENFPLMYHYRLVPVTNQKPAMEVGRLEKYKTHWNNNENIGQYMVARQQAAYEMVLFLECFPHTLWPWINENLDKLESLISQMHHTITFLRRHDIVHFDVHFGNILTDGDTFYLADFGLVLDKCFDLNAEEEAFLEAHTYYDYAELLTGLYWPMVTLYRALEDADKEQIKQSYGIEADTPDSAVFMALLDNIGQLYAEGALPLDKEYVATVLQYQTLIKLASQFFVDLRNNPQKDTPYPFAKVKQLLTEMKFLPGSA